MKIKRLLVKLGVHGKRHHLVILKIFEFMHINGLGV
jgi:hypothetical protein